MSPVSTKPSESSALPPEFSHKALQSLVRKGRTTGSVTGEQVAEALRAADVRANRGRVVLRALDEQGIAVASDRATSRVAAATTRTTKKATASAPTTTRSSGTKTKATTDEGDDDEGDAVEGDCVEDDSLEGPCVEGDQRRNSDVLDACDEVRCHEDVPGEGRPQARLHPAPPRSSRRPPRARRQRRPAATPTKAATTRKAASAATAETAAPANGTAPRKAASRKAANATPPAPSRRLPPT